MSSSSSTKETSLYDKIKLKPTIQNTNINHGLISRGKYGIRTAEGTASYNQNLINISKEGTMQWKDYEKEIHRKFQSSKRAYRVLSLAEASMQPRSGPMNFAMGRECPVEVGLVMFVLDRAKFRD